MDIGSDRKLGVQSGFVHQGAEFYTDSPDALRMHNGIPDSAVLEALLMHHYHSPLGKTQEVHLTAQRVAMEPWSYLLLVWNGAGLV